MKLFFACFTIFLLASGIFAQEESDVSSEELECAVCETVLNELENHLATISPTRQIEVGNYRLDAQGNDVRKTIPMSQSESYIFENLETICENMENFARGREKKTGKIVVLNLFESAGVMNPLIGGDVELITDSDMNKSLKYYCNKIVGEHDEDIVAAVQRKEADVTKEICSEISKLCLYDSDKDSESYDSDKTEL